jgi:hypothetical protein
LEAVVGSQIQYSKELRGETRPAEPVFSRSVSFRAEASIRVFGDPSRFKGGEFESRSSLVFHNFSQITGYSNREGSQKNYEMISDHVINNLVSEFASTFSFNRFKEILGLCGRVRSILANYSGTDCSERFGNFRTVNQFHKVMVSPIWCYSPEYSKDLGKRILDRSDPSLKYEEIKRIDSADLVRGCDLLTLEPSDKPVRKMIYNLREGIGGSELQKSILGEALIKATRYITISSRVYELCVYYLNTGLPEMPLIKHQEPKFHADMTRELFKLLNQAITWDPELSEVSELISRVAAFVYIKSHMCIYDRGSAAICEWFEKAIYKIHGFEVSYSKSKSVNLAALNMSFQEFSEIYPSYIHLQKIDFSLVDTLDLLKKAAWDIIPTSKSFKLCESS